MKIQKGFSLIELMVAMAVIGILAAVAVPAYQDYVIRGKLVRGTAALSDGRIQMEQFYQDHGAYDNSRGGTSPCPTNDIYFQFNCAPTATTYVLTASGVAGQGLSGFAYTINEQNGKATTASTWGSGSTGACWIMKKGQSC